MRGSENLICVQASFHSKIFYVLCQNDIKSLRSQWKSTGIKIEVVKLDLKMMRLKNRRDETSDIL